MLFQGFVNCLHQLLNLLTIHSHECPLPCKLACLRSYLHGSMAPAHLASQLSPPPRSVESVEARAPRIAYTTCLQGADGWLHASQSWPPAAASAHPPAWHPSYRAPYSSSGIRGVPGVRRDSAPRSSPPDRCSR